MINIKIVNTSIYYLLASLLVLLVSLGIPRLIELIDRDAELANNMNATVAINQSILDNMQVYDLDDKRFGQISKLGDLTFITVNSELIKKQTKLEEKLDKLKIKIQDGKRDEIQKTTDDDPSIFTSIYRMFKT
ncbi:MAG: hypothetical protein KAJ63_04915, partial [Methyloprofundus sp.]|nr:hypothetical protein [Methyloprofundus sp.]